MGFTRGSAMNKQKTILVDDQNSNLEALHAILDSADIDYVDCHSGEEAIKKLATEKADLILLDVRLPLINGIETARLIRNNPKTSNVPIILMTAYMLDDAEILKGYQAGAVDYLSGPFNAEALKLKVEFFLNYAKKLRAEQKDLDALHAYENFVELFDEVVNPLWSILLNAQILLKISARDQRKARDLLKSKLEAVERSTRLLRDLIWTFKVQLSEISSARSTRSYTH